MVWQERQVEQLVSRCVCDKCKNESLCTVHCKVWMPLALGQMGGAWGGQTPLPFFSGIRSFVLFPQRAIQIPCPLCAMVWKRLASIAVKVLTLLLFDLDLERWVNLRAVVIGERGLSMKRRGRFLPGELESVGSRESQTREKWGFFRVSQAKTVLSWSLKRV